MSSSKQHVVKQVSRDSSPISSSIAKKQRQLEHPGVNSSAHMSRQDSREQTAHFAINFRSDGSRRDSQKKEGGFPRGGISVQKFDEYETNKDVVRRDSVSEEEGRYQEEPEIANKIAKKNDRRSQDKSARIREEVKNSESPQKSYYNVFKEKDRANQ